MRRKCPLCSARITEGFFLRHLLSHPEIANYVIDDIEKFMEEVVEWAGFRGKLISGRELIEAMIEYVAKVKLKE